VGRAARDMDAFPSLSNGGGLHYLCMTCAKKHPIKDLEESL
jgi:hypothetical protein